MASQKKRRRHTASPEMAEIFLKKAKSKANCQTPPVSKGRMLCFGMFYCNVKFLPKNGNYGQYHRDLMRIKQLEKLGYKVETVDDKHKAEDAGKHAVILHLSSHQYTLVQWKHVQVKCDSMRHFATAFFEHYEANLHLRYDHMVLDYNFSPQAYNDTWNNFITGVLPHLVNTGILSTSGSIWLPGWQGIIEILAKETSIQDLYDVYWVDKINYPLWVASENALPILIGMGVTSFDNQLKPNQDGFLRLISKSKFSVSHYDGLIKLSEYISPNDETMANLCSRYGPGPDDLRKRKYDEWMLRSQSQSPSPIKPGDSGTYFCTGEKCFRLSYIKEPEDENETSMPR